ncbi:MAG: PKD domain-containing protein [Thermoanaerobaculia bacterium]
MRTPTSVRFVTPFVLTLALAGAAARADVVIPSSAFSSGRNSAEFHSDVRVFNPTNSPIDFTPIFYRSDAGGNVLNTVQMPVVTIGPRVQIAYDNVLQTLFGQSLGVFGPILFQSAGKLLVSSSVNNVNACGNGSVSGQWLPGIDVGSALKAGTLVQLAVSANGAAGYRSNVDFMNPGATVANFTVKVRKGDGTQLSSATLSLAANALLQKALDDGGTFPGVAGTTDTNLWVEFTSDQPILVFASVINNASGDPFAIVMTAEPSVPAPAPVASFTVAPASPAPGQAATFTDTSTNSPVNRFWAFGDGAIDTKTTGTATHTYAAAGTYHAALFVDNASGSGSTTKDVVVAAAAPIAVTISATTTHDTKWTFVCLTGPCDPVDNNNVLLKVGQPYVITWTTPQSEAKTHGVAPIGLLGIQHCDDGQDLITASRPCAVTFTPTAAMLGPAFGGPAYTYGCTQTMCAPTQSVHDGMTGTITIVP